MSNSSTMNPFVMPASRLTDIRGLSRNCPYFSLQGPPRQFLILKHLSTLLIGDAHSQQTTLLAVLSFGFGVGDFLAASNIAKGVYEACKDGAEEYQRNIERGTIRAIRDQ